MIFSEYFCVFCPPRQPFRTVSDVFFAPFPLSICPRRLSLARILSWSLPNSAPRNADFCFFARLPSLSCRHFLVVDPSAPSLARSFFLRYPSVRDLSRRSLSRLSSLSSFGAHSAVLGFPFFFMRASPIVLPRSLVHCCAPAPVTNMVRTAQKQRHSPCRSHF